MKKKFYALCLVLLLLWIPTGAMAEEFIHTLPNKCTAFLVGNPLTGDILASHNTDDLLQIASISKLLTYYITKDAIAKGDLTLETRTTVSKHAADVGGSSMYLKEGDKVNVQELLDGMMIISGNDAATVLGELLGGNDLGFAQLMAKKAESLGITKFHFINGSGLPDEREDENRMTVKGLFILSSHLIQDYPEVLEYKNRTRLTIPERNLDLESTMKLFGDYPGVDGLKTGYTEDAGFCLVNSVDMNQDPNSEKDDYRLITIVMGAKTEAARNDLTRELMDYAKKNYINENLLSPDQVYMTIPINRGDKEELSLFPEKAFSQIIMPECRISFSEELNVPPVPITKGQIVGQIHIFKDGKEISQIPLLAGEDIGPADMKTRFKRFIKNIKEQFIFLWNCVHNS